MIHYAVKREPGAVMHARGGNGAYFAGAGVMGEDNSPGAESLNLNAMDAQVNSSFPTYMNELLRANTELEVGMPEADGVRDSATDMNMGNFIGAQQQDIIAQNVADTKSPKSAKRKRPIDKDAPSEKDENKPKRPTSLLRKLQNKLSQQRFRQKKREVESNQQAELEAMQKKIKELEVAKTHLPELRKQNRNLEQSLELKDKEIELLRKEIGQAKAKRYNHNRAIIDDSPCGNISGGIQDAITKKNACNVMKNRLLLATTHEYENTVNELRSIAMSYPGGTPEDDDIEAQRRISPVLYNFVDMAQADSSSPCIRSLLAASLAYLSIHGLQPDVREHMLKTVRNLNLTSVQEMRAMGIRDKLMSDLKLIYDERKDLNQRIQNQFMTRATSSTSDVSPMSFEDALKKEEGNSGLVADVDLLKTNLLCECQMRQNYQVTFFRLLQPIQIMKIILASEPGFPDLISVSNAIAHQVEEDSKNTLSFTEPIDAQ